MFSIIRRDARRTNFRKPGSKVQYAFRVITSGYLAMALLGGIAPINSSLAQTPVPEEDKGPQRFVEVTKWEGGFSWTGKGSGSKPMEGGVLDWTGEHYASGSFEMEGPIFPEGLPDYVRWEGKAQGTGSINDVVTYSEGCRVDTEKWVGSGDIPGKLGPGDGLVPVPMRAELQINVKTGDYLFSLGPETLDIVLDGTYTHCETVNTHTGSFTTALGGAGFSNGRAEDKLPATGLDINGSLKFDAVLPQTLSLVSSEGGEVEWNYQWNIAPAKKEELEVVVQIADYDKWLPEGGTAIIRGPISMAPKGAGLAAPPAQENEVILTDGNFLPMTATLQLVGGGEPTVKADRFRFELIDVSNEPGIAMNSPLKAVAKRDADLQFDPDPAVNSPMQVRVDSTIGNQKAEWIVPNSTQAKMVIASSDYGAWGVLKVTAILQSGKEIVGYIQGDPSQKDIRIPKRSPGSWIADWWKKENGAMGLSDASDIEAVPVGDARVKGDGLTLYQEYRGFFEGGKHLRTDPQVKDLFINDRIGGRSKDGIALFTRITKLHVHDLLKRDEMDVEKLINFNHSEVAPHIEHQNALVLQQARAGGQQSHVRGELGGKPLVPANVKELLVLPPSDMGPNGWKTVKISGKPVKQDIYAATVAHELLHAINVEHHGEGDDEEAHWTWAKDANGKDVLTENGAIITLKNERGAKLNYSAWKASDPGGLDFWVAVPQGQHSGNESCAMRYDVAFAYRSSDPAQPGLRYWVQGEEPVGDQLCESPTGTGVNKDGRRPQSRYGDAAAGQGDCAHQFIVNDVVMWTGIPK